MRLYLHDAHARTDVNQEVGKNARIHVGETIFRISVPLVDENLIVDVFQKKVAALNQAGHFLLLVHTKWPNVTTL